MKKYYHIMLKNGAWHLYAGNAAVPVVTDPEQSAVVKAARSLARQHGGRIVLHKPAAEPRYEGSVTNASQAETDG